MTLASFVLYVTFDLLTLAIDRTLQDALLDSDLNPPPNSELRERLIPKIIHQTYKTVEVPVYLKTSQ